MAGTALRELTGIEVLRIAEGNDDAEVAHHAAKVVQAAQQELDTLMRQRTEIMKRIGAVKQTLMGLTSIFNCSELVPDFSPQPPQTLGPHVTGLTNACRLALLQAGVPLRPHQVRDRIRFQGLDLDNHRDPVATVTTVLRRLGQYGEARPVLLPNGKRAWEWATDGNPAPPLKPE